MLQATVLLTFFDSVLFFLLNFAGHGKKTDFTVAIPNLYIFTSESDEK